MKSEWLFLVLLQLIFVVFLVNVQHSNRKIIKPKITAMKSILIWNSVNRIETAYFNVGSASFIKEKCPVRQCQIFTERDALPFHQYDAVVMNMLELNDNHLPEDEGYMRSSHQRYIFLQQESPSTSPLDVTLYKNIFNLTMTYKLNSDIQLLYGRIKPKVSAPKTSMEVERLISKTRFMKKPSKTKYVAWMVSHCETESFRETYVKELQKYIDVDVIGECESGNFSCPRNEHWISDQECYDYLEKEYKFYLSFENSLCDDYATEKFFNILAHDIVPVVYGGANYSKLAPPHSYIDALQYTPRQLARYLKQISKDDRLYNEFFWWKEYYEVETGIEQMVRNAFCELCRMLHEESTVKIYETIERFWNASQCYTVVPWNELPRERNDTEMIFFDFENS